jgi:hypothetical protein
MFIVKSVDGVEVTPKQEVIESTEQVVDVVETVEQQEEVVEVVEQQEVVEATKLVFEKDEDLISYVRSKNLIDENKVEIPEDLKGYLKYKEETNRSIQDYLELQKDLSTAPEEEIIKKKMKADNPEFSDEEINDEFLDTYGYDEDVDDEKDIKKKVRSYKKAYAEALEYQNKLKEQYATRIEVQSNVQVPQDYEQLKQVAQVQQEQAKVASENLEYFNVKTNELFTNDFEGFKFKIGDNEIVHKPTSIQSVKETQSNVMNFLGKFLDESGRVKDAEAYHKALYVAMNYDSILSNVYETAKAKAIEDEIKSSKNINMDGLRQSPETLQGKRVKYRVIQ